MTRARGILSPKRARRIDTNVQSLNMSPSDYSRKNKRRALARPPWPAWDSWRCCAVLVWLIISRSLVAYLAQTEPETALSLNSSDPLALVALAEKAILFDKNLTTKSLNEARGRLEEALLSFRSMRALYVCWASCWRERATTPRRRERCKRRRDIPPRNSSRSIGRCGAVFKTRLSLRAITRTSCSERIRIFINLRCLSSDTWGR